VIVVDDGPTLTHGGMAYGAGYVAAIAAGAAAIVDPRLVAAPELRRVLEAYPHIGPVLPAVGYSPPQLRALEETINAADADVVVCGSPVDLGHMLRIDKPMVRARYEFAERDEPRLSTVVDAFLDRLRIAGAR
jgi:predicted GTPase